MTLSTTSAQPSRVHNRHRCQQLLAPSDSMIRLELRVYFSGSTGARIFLHSCTSLLQFPPMNIQGTSTQCPVNSHSAGGIYGNSSAARGRGAGDTFIPIFSRLSGQGSPCHVHSTVHQRGKAKQRVHQQLFPRRVYQCNPSTYTGYD